MRINNKDYNIISTPEGLYSGISLRNGGYIVYLEQEEIKEIVDRIDVNNYVVFTNEEYDKTIENEWQKGYDDCKDEMEDEIDDAKDEGYKDGFNEAEIECKEKVKEIEYLMQKQIDDLTKQIRDLEEFIGDMKEDHKRELTKEYQYGRDDGYEDGIKEANS